jgi:hypothetical protein
MTPADPVSVAMIVAVILEELEFRTSSAVR